MREDIAQQLKRPASSLLLYTDLGENVASDCERFIVVTILEEDTVFEFKRASESCPLKLLYLTEDLNSYK